MLMVCGDGKTVYLLKDPIVDGGVAPRHRRTIGGQKLWYVKLALDPQATDTLSRRPTMAGSELALVLDGQVLSAPIIDSSMEDGHVGVTGNYDQAQATKLAHRLTAGQQG